MRMVFKFVGFYLRDGSLLELSFIRENDHLPSLVLTLDEDSAKKMFGGAFPVLLNEYEVSIDGVKAKDGSVVMTYTPVNPSSVAARNAGG